MDSTNHAVILNELNDEEVMLQIPLLIYLTILCIFGTAGNSLVYYIFTKKYTASTYNTFITALSVVDLFTSCIVIPKEFIIQFWQYTFDSVWLCKLAQFLNTWTTLTSGTILICIAFDRYRKVCAPFSWQISLKASKYICIVSAAIGLASSLLSPVIHGIQKMEHDVYNVTISRCTVPESMKKTLFPLINNTVYAILFLVAFIGFPSFYFRIVARVKQQLKWKYKSKSGIEIRAKEIEMTNVSTDNIEDKTDETHELEDVAAEGIHAPESVSTSKDQGVKRETIENEKDKNQDKNVKSSQNVRLSKRKRYRTTMIMFVVSVAFIISYVPLLSLLLIRSVNKTFLATLNDFDRSMYKFFLRSYYLNSAVNPVIYGILDAKFRKSCKLLCSCKKV